eukprot:7315012-Pyramimonas_sp.AAC.1
MQNSPRESTHPPLRDRTNYSASIACRGHRRPTKPLGNAVALRIVFNTRVRTSATIMHPSP